MMQFSVAPWRVLDAAHLAAVKQAVALRMRFTPRILELAQASAATGEPILRPLAYVFPDSSYENVKDQFLMGDNLLVAPMVTKGTTRTVQIPPGQWKADDGTLITGPSKNPSPSPSVVCFTSSVSNAHEQTHDLQARRPAARSAGLAPRSRHLEAGKPIRHRQVPRQD